MTLSAHSVQLDEHDRSLVDSELTKVPSRSEFSRTLFHLLDEHKVHYCVLDSYETLPEHTVSDIDLAVHPRDVEKLPLIFREVAQQGYHPVQCLEYAVGAQYTVFAWFEGSVLVLAAVDVICEHRRNGLILTSGEKLVADCRRLREFWIPNPEIEFSYLLAKKTLKRSLPAPQQELLKRLTIELGERRSERIASDLFGHGHAKQVVQACLDGTLASLLPQLRRRLQLTHLTCHPFKLGRYWLGSIFRFIRRWRRPTGLFLVMLGPDGAGKSSIIDGLLPQIRTAFRKYARFHWRPAVIRKRKIIGPITNPHRCPQHGLCWSIVRLLTYLLDYWLGYWLVIRPILVRSGLVIFDRYCDDMLADPRRYGYGGPLWLVRAVCRLRPDPDLILVLDATEENILSRKQEVAPTDVRRLRQAYLRLACESRRASIIDASQPRPKTAEAVARAVIHHLASRYQIRQSRRVRFWQRSGSQAPSAAEVLPRVIERFFGERWHAALLTRNGRAFRPRPTPSQENEKRYRDDAWCPRRFSYAVLPSCNSPRWLLPLGEARDTLQAIRSYVPYARKGVLAKAALTACIKTGWTGWARDQIEVAVPQLLPIEALVCEIIGAQHPIFALTIGTSPRYPKLTVQVMLPRGKQTLGYIKLPLAEDAKERVRHEVSVLKQLWSVPALRPHLPTILYAGEWNGIHLLFMRPTPGSRGPVRFTESHRSFLQTLGAACPQEKSGDTLVESIASQWHRVGAKRENEWANLGDRILDRASRELTGKAIECGITHGDFTPWNTRIKGNHLFVFDWESATWDKPILWDYFHFHVQVSSLLGFKSSTWLRNFSPHEALILLYLLDSVSSLVEEGVNMEHRVIANRKILIRSLLDKGKQPLRAHK